MGAKRPRVRNRNPRRPGSRARMRLKGTVHFDTRRTWGRYLRFNDPAARKIVLYVLGLAARKYKVDIHVFSLMGNHYDILVSTYFGNYPQFECFLNAQIARAMNRLHEVRGGFWEPIYSNNADQTVLSEPRAFEKARDICRNPILAGLESDLKLWSAKMGMISPLDWNRKIVCEKPDIFWSESMPATVTFTPKPIPKTPSDFDPRSFMNELCAGTEGIQFCGVDAVQKRSPFAVPLEEKMKWEWSQAGCTKRREILAARKPLRRFSGTAEEEKSATLSQLVFAARHRERVLALIAGDFESAFPSGTNALKRLGFAIEPEPRVHLHTRLIRGP